MPKLIFFTLIIIIPIYCFPQNNLRNVQNGKSMKTKNICGTEQEVDKAVNNCLPIDAHPCRYPASRDSFIPDASTPVKYFSLLIIVVDSNVYGVTQENVVSMIADVNNYYSPWKINFCYSIVFIDTSMLSQYPQNPDSVFNVIISDWPNLGLSGNPIKIDYSVVINNNYQGGYSLAHELGHNFKLSHTFSSTELPTDDTFLGCSASCRDRVDYTSAQQDTVGDSMSDTPPTPRNYNCAPPTGVDSCSAGMPAWPAWGYENLMGYSYCPNATFSSQQAGRIHCYIEYGYAKLDKKLAYGMLHCDPLSIINNTVDNKSIYFDILPNPFKE